MNNVDIQKIAEKFAKENKKYIAKEITNPQKYVGDEFPLSIFMAGSPGAGKTEYSKNLILILEKNREHRIIRIDGDDIRTYLPGYNGTNSFLFQKAISSIVEKIHDFALNNGQTFLLDGTFANYNKAIENINRSLSRSRQIIISYVYQNPFVAWKFTKARESKEGRNIPKEVFIRQFLSSRETVERIRKDFNDEIVISLVKKNVETHDVEYTVKLKQYGPHLDYYLGSRYNENDLREKL